MKVYVIGSLRNPKVRNVALRLREAGFNVFDDWHAAGPEADDIWRDYEQQRGRSYMEALAAPLAQKNFEFDREHIEASDAVVLVLPAGRSCHLEFGFAIGKGIPGIILLEEADPERWDLMYNFADAVVSDVEDLIEELNNL